MLNGPLKSANDLVQIDCSETNQGRAFPAMQRRSETFKHTLITPGLAVALLGLEAEEEGRLMGADASLRELYPDVVVVLLQYTRGGVEKTSLQFESNEQLFNVVGCTMAAEHIQCTTNFGHARGHPITHITFEGPISGRTLGMLVKDLRDSALFSTQSTVVESGQLEGAVFNITNIVNPDNN